jgi:hypothetical protein
METKDKAKELIEKYADALPSVFYNSEEAKNYARAKKCALIAVDEIIKSSPARSPGTDSSDFMPHFKAVIFWEEVKQEIEKL